MHYEISITEQVFFTMEFSSRIECDILQAYCGFLHTAFYARKDMEYPLAPKLICRLLKNSAKLVLMCSHQS